jgi:hypothetical protein
MLFIIIFLFLFEIVFCAEPPIKDITLETGGQQYSIFYLDPSDSLQDFQQLKPFNKGLNEIQLNEIEVGEIVSSAADVYPIIRNTQCITFAIFYYNKDFSAIAKRFKHANLDVYQKKYVLEILNAAKNLQSVVRKYTTLEMGKGIMPVLSTFITESCTPKIFDNNNDRLNDDIRLSVWNFLNEFNKSCETYYLKAYEQTNVHFKIDVSLGLFLVLSLYYMHIKNLHFIAGHHSIEKLILIGAYGACLVYDLKARLHLYMTYRQYVKQYEDLIDPAANKGYLFFF